MAKDPAFLFYPGDWQGGTMHMTHLEKGCYMDLLMLQFNRGKFTEAQAKHMLQSSFDVAWATIQEKFQCQDGLYWNERLALEKEKRVRFTESRRNNGKGEKHMNEHMLEHTDKRMEDENKDVIILEKDKKRGVGKGKGKTVFAPPTIAEVVEFFKSKGHSEAYAQKAFDHYDLAGWHDTHGNPVKAWKQKMNTNWVGKPEPANMNPVKTTNGAPTPNRVEYTRADMGGRKFFATMAEWRNIDGCFPAGIIEKVREFYTPS